MARKSELSMNSPAEKKIEHIASSSFNPIVLGMVVLVLSIIGYFLVTNSLGATDSRPGVATQEVGDMVPEESSGLEESEFNFDELAGPKKPSPPLLLVWLLSGAGVLAVFAILAVLFGMPWWERKRGLRQAANVDGPQTTGAAPVAAPVTAPVAAPVSAGSVLPDLLSNNSNVGYLQPTTPNMGLANQSGNSSSPTGAVGPVLGASSQPAQVAPVAQPQYISPNAPAPNITPAVAPAATQAPSAAPVSLNASINPVSASNAAAAAVYAQPSTQPMEPPQVASIPATPMPPGQSTSSSIPPVNPPDAPMPGNQV